MDLKQVQCLLAVANARSFSRAAEELYISQSSLSKQIIALERELDVELFDRSKRQITLTPAGEALLPYACSLDEAYQAVLQAAGEYKAAPALSVLAIPVIAQYGIPAYIALFRSLHAEIVLTLEEREAAAILPALSSYQYDLAFVRDNYLDASKYILRQVVYDKLIVAVSQRHRFADRKYLALAELADENHIVFDKGTVVHELVVDACRAQGFEPRIFYASLRVESVLGLVASNSGVALMMERVVAYHQRPDVVAIPLEETVGSNIVLVAPKSKKLSWPARAFLEFIGTVAAEEHLRNPHEP
jgi:DNA-binding transcriptional LysR family regulator